MKNYNLKLKTGFKLLTFVFIFSFLVFNSVMAASTTFAIGGGATVGDEGGGRDIFKTPPDNIFNLEVGNPLGTTSIIDLIHKIINVLTLYIATPVAVLMIIIGAFQMLSAGGDPEKFSTGKKTILYAAIGFAILLSADILIGLVQDILGVKVK